MRGEFWDKIRNIPVEHLVFIDESGVNLALTRLYARALKGIRARGKRPEKRGKNISIIGAMTVKGVLASFNVFGPTDGITFEAFIKQRLVPKLWKNACVVMDNCSIHYGKEIKKAIEEAGAKVIYLPPYSPEFSPIENFWSKVKTILRKVGARTYQDLEQAIDEAFQQVSEKDIWHWFTHCCYCTSPI